MRYFNFLGILLVFIAVTAHAETKYVIDILKITLRSGPGTEHRIIKMLESGQRVQVLEQDGEWAKVSLSDSKEGWVLNRYISYKKTNKLVLEKLEREHQQLLVEFDKMLKENEKIKAENRNLSTELTSTKKMLGHTANSYNSLKEGSADYIHLKEKHDRTVTELTEKSKHSDGLEEKLTERSIYLFISGAVLLLFGFIIGINSKAKRKRSSLGL